METKKLYRIIRKGGGITITPNYVSGCEEAGVRLIADEGKLLTNGKITTSCIDVESAEGWSEIDALEEEDDV